MDDISDVWGGGGVSPTSERRGSDVRSTDSRVRGRRKQKERSPPVQPVIENKPLLPEHREATISKHSLWSSKSSLPSINESVGDGHKRNPSSSSASPTNTDEAYDTVKRAPPGVMAGGKMDSEQDVAPDMTPAKIIVFERGKDGEKARLITQPEEKVETKPPTSSSANKNILLRAQSHFAPKVTKDQQDEKGTESEMVSEVRKSVSLHENRQRQDGGSKIGQLKPKHPKSLTNIDGPSDV